MPPIFPPFFLINRIVILGTSHLYHGHRKVDVIHKVADARHATATISLWWHGTCWTKWSREACMTYFVDWNSLAVACAALPIGNSTNPLPLPRSTGSFPKLHLQVCSVTQPLFWHAIFCFVFCKYCFQKCGSHSSFPKVGLRKSNDRLGKHARGKRCTKLLACRH